MRAILLFLPTYFHRIEAGREFEIATIFEQGVESAVVNLGKSLPIVCLKGLSTLNKA
jgi:hypothetical protein